MRRAPGHRDRAGQRPRRGRSGLRRVAVGLASLASVAVIAVVALSCFTHTERFDAGVIVVRSQPGTDAASRALARDGARLALQWVGRTSGPAIRDPVEVRLANRGKCLWVESLDSSAWSGTDVTGDDFICVYVRDPRWRAHVAQDPDRAREVVAHETIHHAQRALGCVDDPGGFRFQWLVEGMATWGAAQALVDAGAWTPQDVARYAREDDGELPRSGLRAFEASGASGAYSLGRRAVAELVARRSAADLWRFCREVGRGTEWRSAFRGTFGLTVDAFYRAFDRAA